MVRVNYKLGIYARLYTIESCFLEVSITLSVSLHDSYFVRKRLSTQLLRDESRTKVLGRSVAWVLQVC
jgi:hypothetical protein